METSRGTSDEAEEDGSGESGKETATNAVQLLRKSVTKRTKAEAKVAEAKEAESQRGEQGREQRQREVERS